MISSGRHLVSLEELLKHTSEAQLLHSYLGVQKVPCVIKSPLRKDNNPSFGLYSPDGVRIYYKDYSTGDTGGLFDLLSQMWSLSFNDVLVKIWNDLGSTISTITPKKTVMSHIGTSVIEDLQVKIRKWKDYDIEYWKSYGISLKWLKLADIYPISHKFITKEGKTYTFGAAKYAYTFVEKKDGKITHKIYQPLVQDKSRKWMTNIDRSVWSLWTKVPKTANNLFISSSLKDCLNLWANTGIPAICMQGEGYTPKEHIIQDLKNRYKNIIIFYDNDYKNPDNPGRTDAKRLADMFGFKKIEIPEKYEAKDPSDLFLKYGKDKYLEIMKELLKNIII